MLGFLKGDPKKKLQKEYEAKLQKALHAQRNGDLRTCLLYTSPSPRD